MLYQVVKLVVDGIWRLWFELKAPVVAQLDNGFKGHRRLEYHRVGLGYLDSGTGDRLELLLFECFFVCLGQQVVQGIFEQPVPADMAFQHLPRRLALAEAGDFGSLGQPMVG